MMVIAHLLGFALIFIACTFDFMRLALVPEKSNTSLIFPRSSSLFSLRSITRLCTWLEKLWEQLESLAWYRERH